MEKKILIIPDVHGRSFWRPAVASGDYDKIIFLGDYVDPYPDERIGELTALHGLMDIITPHYACLDCRTAFVLDEEGLKPLKNY